MATSTATGKKRMTQSEVFNHFAERTGMKRAQVKQFFDDLANLATSEVKSGGEFVLPGFGKLVRSERKAREGRKDSREDDAEVSRGEGHEGLRPSSQVRSTFRRWLGEKDLSAGSVSDGGRAGAFPFFPKNPLSASGIRPTALSRAGGIPHEYGAKPAK